MANEQPTFTTPDKMKFEIKTPNNLLVSIVHLPAGDIEVESKMSFIKDGVVFKESKIGHILLEGPNEKIIEKLLIGAANVLIKGKAQNLEDEAKKIIKPA